MRSPHLMVFPSVALVILAGLLTVNTHSASNTQKVAPNIKIRNKTSGLEVLGARVEKEKLVISLKNNYPQKVTASVFSFGPTSRVIQEFALSEGPDGIAPGENHERAFYFSPARPMDTITIEAVVLEDGTGDGDPLAYQDVMELRLGQAIQFKRALKILRSSTKSVNDPGDQVSRLKFELATTLDCPEMETVAELNRMRPVSFVNRDSDAESLLPGQVQIGLANAKGDILRRVDQLDRKKPLNENLLKLTRYYERALSNFKLATVSP